MNTITCALGTSQILPFSLVCLLFLIINGYGFLKILHPDTCCQGGKEGFLPLLSIIGYGAVSRCVILKRMN